MAFTAREVIMTFRGQNYLSSAIRRVGRDVGSLSRTQALTQQRAALQLARQRIQLSQRAAQAELVSVQPGGARSLAIQKARNAALAEQANLTRQIGARETALLGIQGSRLANTTKIANLQRDIGNVPGELQAQRAAIRAQIQQLTTGTKALSVQKAQVTEQLRQNQQLVRTNALTQQIMRNDERQLQLQARYERLAVIPPTSRKFTGVPAEMQAIRAESSRLQTQRTQLLATQAGLAPEAMARQEAQLALINAQEGELISKTEALKASYRDVGAKGATQLATLRNALAQANIESARLVGREAELRASVEAARKALQEQGLTLQQIDAREAQLAEREAQLTQTLLARGRAEEIVNEKMRQTAVAMQMLPWETFERGARAVEHAGRVLQMFGLISTAVFGYAAEQAAKFSTQTTLAATQVVDAGNKSIQNVQKVSQQTNQILTNFLASGQTTARPEELTSGIYRIWSSLTLPGNQQARIKEGTILLKDFNQVLTANYGQVDFNEVIGAGVRIINNFDKNLKNIPADLNTMQAAVRFGNLTMQEFISMLDQAAPAGRAAGYSFQYVASSLAFLSRTLSPRIAATGFARLTEFLAKNAQKFREHGIEVNKAGGGLRSLEDITTQLIKKFPGLATGHENIINIIKNITGTQSTVQARRALNQYLYNPEGARTIRRQVTGDVGELARAAVAAGTSPGVAWAKFTNQLRGLVLLIGQGAIPAFVQLARPIERFIQWFDQLSPKTQRMIGYFGALVSAGALVGGTFMAIAGGLGVLVSAVGKMIQFSRLSGEGGLIARIFGGAGLAGTAGSASAIVGIGAALPGVIYLLIRYHKQVMDVINALGGLHKVLLVVSAVAGVLITARAIRGLQTLTSEAFIARDAIVALRLGLAALAAVGTIIVTIDIIKQLIDQYLPGLNDKGFSPKNQTVGGYATAAAASKRAIQTTKDAVRQATPQYRAAVREAEKLFAQGLNPQQVADRLNSERPALAKKLAEGMAGPISDAMVLYKAISKGRTGSTKDDPVGTDLIKKRADSVTHWINMVERARARMLANPNDLQAAKAYETVQAQLNKHFKDQPQLLAAINDVLSNYNSNLKQSAANANQLGTTFQDVLIGIQNMYQGFQQTETGLFGGLFQGPFMAAQDKFQFGARMTGQDALRDIRSQLTQFRNFHGELNRLQRRGAPRGLVQELIGLGSGPEQLRNLQAINSLSPSQLKQYFNAYNQGQQLIKAQTMRDLNAQLKIYRQHGRNIALAIIAGLRDENVNLTTSLTRMIRRMFPGLPVGETGAGGRPTHRAQPKAGTTHNHYYSRGSDERPNKPPITKRAQQRHAELRTKNKHSVPVGGPR